MKYKSIIIGLGLLGLSACKESVAGNDPSSSSLSSETLSSSAELSSSQSSSSQAPSSSSLSGYPRIVQPQAVDTSGFSPAPQTQIKIATWANFAKSAYSLTFDDGFKSHYNYVRPVLNKYQIKGTFFVITHTLQEPGAVLRGRGGSWDQFQTLAAEGHEIASHTQTHPDLTNVDSVGLIYELDSAAAEIRQRIPSRQLLTLSTPYCNSNNAVRPHIGQVYLASRDCANGIIDPLPSLMLRVGSNAIMYDTGRTLAKDQAKMEAFEKSLETSLIPYGKWHTYLAHEVVPFDSIGTFVGYHPVSVETFEPFVAWLKQKMDAGDLWVTPFGNAARYVAEKNLLKAGVLYEGESEIRLRMDDGLSDSDYNQELSVEITLPSTWSSARASQGGKDLGATMVGGKLRFNFLPSSTEITLSKN